MKIIVIAALAALLSACATSPVWYATHPEKRVVSDVSVVPRGQGRYDAWGGDDSAGAPAFKTKQIQAVEKAFGCKVSSAEYMPTTALLQTTCN